MAADFDRSRAVCRDVDPDLFYPVSEYSPADLAKSYCNGTPNRRACPVREACLDYALARGEQFGVWGGHTAPERRRMPRAAVTVPSHGWKQCAGPDCGAEVLVDGARRYCSDRCVRRAQRDRKAVNA